MNHLHQLMTWLRAQLNRRRGRLGMPQQGALTGHHDENPAALHHDDGVDGPHEMFTPRHESENEVRFQPIDQDGRFPEHDEEFRRDGNTRSAHFRRTFVETISGSVVPPERVRGRCQCCRGFEDEAMAFCASCGKGLCRRCQRRFNQGTTEVVLCSADLRRAQDAVNTWAMLDHPSANQAK